MAYGGVGIACSMGSRLASRGPEYLMQRFQAEWPLGEDRDGNPVIRDEEWMRRRPNWCARFSIVLAATAVIMEHSRMTVWYQDAVV